MCRKGIKNRQLEIKLHDNMSSKKISIYNNYLRTYIFIYVNTKNIYMKRKIQRTLKNCTHRKVKKLQQNIFYKTQPSVKTNIYKSRHYK